MMFYDFNLSVTRCEDGVYGFFFITLSLISRVPGSLGPFDQPLMFSIRDINLTQKTSYLQAGYMNVDMYTIINAIRANRIIKAEFQINQNSRKKISSRKKEKSRIITDFGRNPD